MVMQELERRNAKGLDFKLSVAVSLFLMRTRMETFGFEVEIDLLNMVMAGREFSPLFVPHQEFSFDLEFHMTNP